MAGGLVPWAESSKGLLPGQVVESSRQGALTLYQSACTWQQVCALLLGLSTGFSASPSTSRGGPAGYSQTVLGAQRGAGTGPGGGT